MPIFWGCENIGEYFNEKGILRFNNPKEFLNILNNLTMEKYQELLPYVKENFEIAKGHIQLDDRVCDAILGGIRERDGE